MQIESSYPQPINPIQPEVSREIEEEMDVDDEPERVSQPLAAYQVYPESIGTNVDLFA